MVDMANHDFLNIFDYRSATFFPYVRSNYTWCTPTVEVSCFYEHNILVVAFYLQQQTWDFKGFLRNIKNN